MAKKKTTQKTPEKKTDIQRRELTPEEQQRLDVYRQRKKNQSLKFKIKQGSKNGTVQVEPDYPDDPLYGTKYMEALGTSDSGLQIHLLNQAALSFVGVASADDTDIEKPVQACNTAMAKTMKTVDEPHAKRQKKPIFLKNGNRQGNPANAPRCGAKTRRKTPCKAPAMANGRCRLHGGKSTGPRTPEGLERSRNANYKHGFYSEKMILERRYNRLLLQKCREFLDRVK